MGNNQNDTDLNFMKRVLETSSTPVYNLLRKVIGCESDMPSVSYIFEIASTLGEGCYFFLL